MNLKQVFYTCFLIGTVISFASCKEKSTEDANEAYFFWSGEKPNKEIEVLHGKYWQSRHWSKEYVIYLELKASPLWRREFIKQNNLVVAKTQEVIPSDRPSWFMPDTNFLKLVPSGSNEGSVYFEDTVTGKVFIYEIQL